MYKNSASCICIYISESPQHDGMISNIAASYFKRCSLAQRENNLYYTLKPQ